MRYRDWYGLEIRALKQPLRLPDPQLMRASSILGRTLQTFPTFIWNVSASSLILTSVPIPRGGGVAWHVEVEGWIDHWFGLSWIGDWVRAIDPIMINSSKSQRSRLVILHLI